MFEESSDSESDYSKLWIEWFLGAKGHEYYCDVDDEYVADKFNLTGLSVEVPYYQQALDLLNDSLDEDLDAETKQNIEKAAEHLYGLIHARYILTSRGLQKMAEKFKRAEFGRCPRVYCANQPVLPVGTSDIPRAKTVKLYCPKCEDIYTPKSSRHARIDGAYFGTTFPHMLLQVHPHLMPPKSEEKYVPRIFGFKIHPSAYKRPGAPATSTNGLNADESPSAPQPPRYTHTPRTGLWTSAGAVPGSWGADPGSP